MKDKNTILLTLTQLDNLDVVIIIPDNFEKTLELQVTYDSKDCKFTPEQIQKEINKFLMKALNDIK